MGSGNGQHDYHACRDQECERYACRIWKEAWARGLRDGQGYDDGSSTASVPAHRTRGESWPA